LYLSNNEIFLSYDKDFVKDRILNNKETVPCNIFSYIHELVKEHDKVLNDIKIQDNLLDAVCNIIENPPEIPRLDRIEAKINEIIEWSNNVPPEWKSFIEKLPE